MQYEYIRKITDEIKNENTIVLFFDPCHLQHNVVNARMWQPKGKDGTIRVPSNSGRKRINIIGALNIQDYSTIITLTEEKCNAIKIVEFLQTAREKYPDKNITIVLDNARYNHARYTTTFAEWYNIELLFLPPYSPNLNLIERLWKFSKKILVNNKYHETFDIFKNSTENFFENLQQYNTEIKSLITQKFQILH